MELVAGDALVRIDPRAGGRVAALRVDGLDVLVAPDAVGGEPTLWGCYPMVPWAGRVRDGRFAFAGRTVELPLGAPPHALHGTGYLSSWDRVDDGTLRLDLGPPWPFGGTVEQRFRLEPDRLELAMTVTAGDRAMPVVAGWHPCFRRRLDRGDPARLDVPARSMWARDATGIPTGEQVPVPPGPWDDAFTDLAGPPRVTWPGALALTLRSDCPTWVVYDEDTRLVCVEPQTDAPDAFNRTPTALEPGTALDLALTIAWASA